MTPPTRAADSRAGGNRSPIDPRIRQRRVAVARHQGRRRLRIVVVVVVVVVGMVVGMGLLHTGLFSAKKVAVTGSHPQTSTATILAAAGLTGHPPLISVNTGAVADKVERLPWIATAKVTRNWPDHITIAVTERVAVASMAGPGTSWSEVDRTGRTVQVDAARPTLVDVAVRDSKGGVPPAPLASTANTAALPALRVARTLPPAFSTQVTQVVGNDDGTVDLSLNSGLTVLLGTDKDLHAKYLAVAAIIAGAPLQGAKTIDVTVPQSPTVSPT